MTRLRLDHDPVPHTVHEAAADWSWMQGAKGFRLKRGRVVWEVAEYVPDRQGRNRRRIGRVITGRGVTQSIRYVDPGTLIELAY